MSYTEAEGVASDKTCHGPWDGRRRGDQLSSALRQTSFLSTHQR